MFIGDLVKLKSDTQRQGKDKEFIQNAIKEDWTWLITSMDNEDLDYIIQPLYLDSECYNMIQLGGQVLVLYDEIEKLEINREELFRLMNNQSCNC